MTRCPVCGMTGVHHLARCRICGGVIVHTGRDRDDAWSHVYDVVENEHDAKPEATP